VEKRESPVILYVDDEPNILDTSKAILQREGYGVFTSGDPLGSLKIFEECRPDLVILDNRMDYMTGLELAVKMRAIDPNVPIIFSIGVWDDVPDDNNFGAGRHLKGRDGPEQLISLVRNMLLPKEHAQLWRNASQLTPSIAERCQHRAKEMGSIMAPRIKVKMKVRRMYGESAAERFRQMPEKKFRARGAW